MNVVDFENEIQKLNYSYLFTAKLPILHQLILDEMNDEFKAFRWSLFQWLLGLESEPEFISTIDQLSHVNGKYLRLVVFTLNFLLKVIKKKIKIFLLKRCLFFNSINKCIARPDRPSADIIFITENDVDLNLA